MISDSSGGKKQKKKYKFKRRLQEDYTKDVFPTYSENTDLFPTHSQNMNPSVSSKMTQEKCTWTEREVVCMRYSEQQGNGVIIELEYATMDLVDSKEDKGLNLLALRSNGVDNSVERLETNEWTIEDMLAENGQIFECHDNFDLFDEICIEKWQLQQNDITVLLFGAISIFSKIEAV